MLPGAKAIEGGGTIMVRFAVITWEGLTAPNASNVIVALYVPAAIDAVFAET
jgi:hypothetical protein